MKTKMAIALISAFLFIAGDSLAQQKKDKTTFGQDVKQAGKSTGKAVKKAGKKVGEVGAKGAAKVKDKSVKGVKGPNGETVYIDEHQNKYYINKKAKRVYIK